MKIAQSIVFLFLSIVSFSQNLVPNGSFEGTDQQFCGIMQIGDFDASVTNWYSPSQGTPDLYYTTIPQSCFNYQPNSTYTGPIGLKGPQLPRTGENLGGLFLYSIAGFEQREYMQVQLIDPLSIGGKYLVECYVSLCDSTEFATDDIGMYLSEQPVSVSSNAVLNFVPQIAANNVISDIHNWVRIADTITANFPHEYLTIGNFRSDAQTTLTSNPLSNGKPGMYGAYMFVEDVRVERIIEGGVGMEELQLAGKTLIKIVDFLGREVNPETKVPQLYMYSDGSVERRLVIE